ncbi:3-dehydroquinate synthase [Pelagicoccus sp. SDUM812003]|uniref:3-dehydroquinate synthase n=1 Tax=Pelagicoccus sp. SDUM812003 TaxID=3041267 RepID=UPI00280C7A84|nr:3-dehydroquinate synthase [Pelagicoccus sp. SDUM812003]MDQ8202833.1 3-dehydroquinate synthase [Pelagicoccus sp. SDUM812003]
MSNLPNIEHSIAIPYQLRVLFTENAFDSRNLLFSNLIRSGSNQGASRVIFYIDEGVAAAQPQLARNIASYCAVHGETLDLRGIHLLPAGEAIKNETDYLKGIYAEIEAQKICRHSYIVAIGGGALLDTVGFAAATAHRGIRLVRFPSTTLGQGDAGVGVKNGFNFRGKKNFVGAFAPPFAVVNDFSLLDTLPEKHLRNGYIEAIKVALIRDRDFFEWIEANAKALAAFDTAAMREIIHRSAQHHVAHIATSGDPFETGSVRPLDFGHWAAHKLEQLSGFRISHGEAVAIGIALDTIYSERMGLLDPHSAQRILDLIRKLGFETYAPELELENDLGQNATLAGLEEFREHLGGELTITLLSAIGKRLEIHEMDTKTILQSISDLRLPVSIELGR